MFKLVSNQISPNLTLTDGLLGRCYLPWIKSKKSADFSDTFGTTNYLLTNAARTALGLIVEVLNPPKTKKIGIPAFICGVVATPFLEAGYQIEWIDTDKNGVISYDDFVKKSAEISVLVCPHIFGQKVALKKFYEHCQTKNIFLIEDCAHSWELGSKIQYADARILSFGREKVYSCVSGGALIWNENHKKSADFSALTLPTADVIWTWKHLFQPIIFSLALPWWRAGGKILPWLAQKAKLLPLAVTKKEKNGREDFPKTALPYPLQKILKRQFKRSQKTQKHREFIARQWEHLLPQVFPNAEVKNPPNFFRTILRTEDAANIIQQAQKHGFHLRDWDGVPISPTGVDLKKFGYTKGQCPNAEKFATSYVTFPTNIRVTKEDTKKIRGFF